MEDKEPSPGIENLLPDLQKGLDSFQDNFKYYLIIVIVTIILVRLIYKKVKK